MKHSLSPLFEVGYKSIKYKESNESSFKFTVMKIFYKITEWHAIYY